MHNVGYQFMACGEDKVSCKKKKITCLNTCGGSDGAEYKHDFATIVSSTELSQFVLGEGFDTQAAADCTVRSYTFKVPIFRGGDSFATFAARMRVRSGMTAISTEFCNANALSCGVIQNVLEKAPGLVFVNGAFRHKYSLVPPSPPPSPSAPPRLFAYAPRPPMPPPPPGTPPPYYAVRSSDWNPHTPRTPRTRTARTTRSPDLTPGRRAVPAAAAPHRLRPGHHDRRGRRRRDRGARELPLRAPRLGCG